jgi:hypothetical protein
MQGTKSTKFVDSSLCWKSCCSCQFLLTGNKVPTIREETAAPEDDASQLQLD